MGINEGVSTIRFNCIKNDREIFFSTRIAPTKSADTQYHKLEFNNQSSFRILQTYLVIYICLVSFNILLALLKMMSVHNTTLDAITYLPQFLQSFYENIVLILIGVHYVHEGNPREG